MKKKIPILLLTNDRPNLLEKVLKRIIRYTDWNNFDLWILDNFSTRANLKIINLFKANYPFINVFSTKYNQLAHIQNEIIRQLKADVYIKIDDDIFVTEGWTDALVEVYNRNHSKMSFGSVVIPINGFGWIPFLEIMNYKQEFIERFPQVELKQGCMDVAVWNDKEVNEFIWSKCMDMDATAAAFKANQNGQYKDLSCPHRYSIGAIIFSHKVWEEMGGWRVQVGYDKVLKRQKQFNTLASNFKKYFNKASLEKYSKANLLADIFSGATTSEMGGEEEAVCNYSFEKGLIIPVTTQGIVFHFSFGPLDQHLMNKIYLNLN